MYSLNPEIDKDYILSRIKQEEIFERYLGLTIDVNKEFTNPLRIDEKTGCRFFYDREGKLRFNDFSRGKTYDCFDIVIALSSSSMNFRECLNKIAEDFNLKTIQQKYDSKKLHTNTQEVKRNLRIKRREWDEMDIRLWAKWGITKETLIKYKVSPLECIWYGGDKIYTYYKKDPAYVFHFNGYEYKIYLPNRVKGERVRFYQNISENVIMGEIQLPEKGDILIINKGYKEVMLCEELSLSGVAPITETVRIPVQKIQEYKKRFISVYSLMDFDATGVANANYLRKHGVKPLFLTNGRFGTQDYGEKDICDFHDMYGMEELYHLRHLIL